MPIFASSKEDLTKLLQQRFGFDAFRPGQLLAIQRLLEEGNLLCLQPTGFGKSLLYQLPSLLLEGVTLVISPLLALMRDQIDHLNERFQIPAACINSDQSMEENDHVLQAAARGMVKILFVAPEQLDHLQRLDFLLSLPISLLVVDEAHCISTWGHDFRPSYRQIVQFVHQVWSKNSQLRVLGLTATADKTTEEDIAKQLSLPGRPLQVLRESMDRSNIALQVFRASSMAEKLELLFQLIEKVPGGGLVYCETRENTELVAQYLQHRQVHAAAYHAGIEALEKRKLQKQFIEDHFKVLCATNALGMGIDKPNIRFIIHFDVPGSITAYYQEVGRCGRDGLPSYGFLLFDLKDKKIQQHFIESSQPKREDFFKILSHISSAENFLNLQAIKRDTGLHPTRVMVVVAELVEQGFIEKKLHQGKQVYVSLGKKQEPDLVRYEEQYRVKSRELHNILHYGEQNDHCRMKILRRALGDLTKETCGKCCVCTESKLLSNPGLVALATAESWLRVRMLEIAPMKLHKVSLGFSLLDGKARLPSFVQFMQCRAQLSAKNMGMDKNLVQRITEILTYLSKKHRIKGVIPIPSRTWGARDAFAEYCGKVLRAPVYFQALSWQVCPSSRQGELLNNEQRKENVAKKMGVTFPQKPTGSILLLDDYIGSGNTIKEAARALRKEGGFTNEIIPLTVAQLRWKIGQPGFV